MILLIVILLIVILLIVILLIVKKLALRFVICEMTAVCVYYDLPVS